MASGDDSTSGSGERWASRIGVILAVAGSAVGLGNFLRFPGQAAQYGGGAFMLPYFISLLVLGIPLCWAEWTMGRCGGRYGFNSSPGIFSVIWRHRAAKYFGALALVIPLVIYMYYVLIEFWCLGYAINYLNGDLVTGTGGTVDQLVVKIQSQSPEPISDAQATSQAFGDFMKGFVGADKDGSMFTEDRRGWLLVLFGVFVLNFSLIYRGISKGIETFCKVAMPLMILLALIVLVRVLTLGTPDPASPDQSVIGGLGFMWNPHSEALWNAKTWLAASGQIFFSLSVGFGIIINYASYLRPQDDIALSGLTASSMNEFFEVCLGGLITIPAAFIFLGALQPDVLDSTFALGFVALPNVFNAMWGGQAFGFLWFFMLFVAAITSSVSMLQPVIAFLEEGFGLKRHASATVLGLITAIGGGFVLYFSEKTVALDTFDFWVGTFLIFVLAMFQTILYGWIFGIDRGEEELHRGAHIRVPRFVQYVLRYVAPVYLLAIFAMFCWQELPSKEEPAFDASPVAVGALQRGVIPESLVAELDQHELALPDAAQLTSAGADGPWTIRSEDGAPALVLRSAQDDVGQPVLNVATYSMGAIEKISRNVVALSSVTFIALVLLFLLLMVHIAGRRWEAEERLPKRGE